MKVYKHNRPDVPAQYMRDCLELQKFIRNKMNIHISLIDTYLLWSDISESWSAGWLSIDTHYDDMTREAFLHEEMRRRGVIIKEDYED